MESNPDVLKALTELDESALAKLPPQKLPALRKAIQKEYRLTEEEATYVIDKKIEKQDSVTKEVETNQNHNSNGESLKTNDQPKSTKLTIREKKVRPGMDVENLRLSTDGFKSEHDKELVDPITKNVMINPFAFPCGHSLSETTVASWMQKYSTCPICSKPANLLDLRPNFALKHKLLAYQNKQQNESDLLELIASTEVSDVPYNVSKEFSIMSTLKAPSLYKSVKEASAEQSSLSSSNVPLCIVAVVDISNDSNREGFLSSIKFISSQLNDRDTLGIITYGKSANILIPPTPLTMEGRTRVLSSLLDLQTDSQGSNLADGLFLGVQAIQKQQQTDNDKKIYSLALFSSSKPDQSRDEILEVYQQQLLKSKSYFNVYTFGLGSSANWDLLSDIAKYGHGIYYCVESKQEYDSACADYLGSITSILAANVSIHVQLDENVNIKMNNNTRYIIKNKTDKSISIDIGDISLDESRDLIVTVKIPEIESPISSNVEIASFTVKYFNTFTGNEETHTTSCTISRSKDVKSIEVNNNIDKHNNRLAVVECLLKAAEKPTERDTIINDTINKLKSSPSSSDLLTQRLSALLNDLLDKKSDCIESKLCSLAQANLSQRSTHSMPLYNTHAKMTALNTLKTFSERKTLRKARVLKNKNISVKESVALPSGYPKNDWLAEHVETFLEQTKRIFDMISDKCTSQSCPEMTAGPRYSYLWADDNTPEPISLPAKNYINNLFEWISNVTKNEKIFPPRGSFAAVSKKSLRGKNQESSKHFLPTVKNVFRRLARVFAHVYYHHFEICRERELEQELNSTFKWFYYFATAFELVDRKDFEPLQQLIDTFQ